MRSWHWGYLIGLGCLLLAGCVEPRAPVTSAEAVALLQTGRPLLSCREPCLAEWQRAQPQAAQLAAGARWSELAALVLRVGYQDDLTEYYLGRAAEGIGYPGAASSYYRQSMPLSGTSLSCQVLSHLCGGVELPRAAALRLAAIDRELARRYRRTGPASRTPAPAPGDVAVPEPSDVAAPIPNEAAPPASSEAGPPLPIPTPALAPPVPIPVPRPVTPRGFDYIEPPPLMR